MEDWVFRYLNPNEYSLISKLLNMRRVEREKYIEKLIKYLEGIFRESDIEKYNISGRAKHTYSIFRKIQRKQVDFSEIYDTSAVRILVSSLEDCYTALSIVHTFWEPIAKEFDDYIAKPKYNRIGTVPFTPPLSGQRGTMLKFKLELMECTKKVN